jgi:hypothetical protein
VYVGHITNDKQVEREIDGKIDRERGLFKEFNEFTQLT